VSKVPQQVPDFSLQISEKSKSNYSELKKTGSIRVAE